MTALRQRLGPNAARVAAMSALSLLAIVVLLLVSGSGSTYTMKAQFQDVRGLIPGAPVRAGAVPVGSVDSVRLVGDAPVVTMKIKKAFALHQGATADIQLFSNAGAVNRTVELTQGDLTRPKLPHGSTMRAPATDQPVNFDDAAEVLDAPTRTNIKRFLGGLDAALKGRGHDFDRSLRHSSAALNETANLLAQVNSDGAALKTLVAQGSKVTAALASSPGDIASAADHTAALLNVTAHRQAELGRSVQLLGPALERGRTALATLASTAPRLRHFVHQLGPVADEIGPFAKILPPTLRAAGPFLVETRRLVEQAPANLRAFSPIIAAAHSVTGAKVAGGGLKGVLQQVLPLGQTLRAYIPDTVGFFQNLGSSLGTYDANGHMLSEIGGLYLSPPGSTAKTNGPNDCTPGRLALPYTRAPGALECQPWTDYENSFLHIPGVGR